ncbi:hypothetical protein [Streptomyces sp. NBC_01187]|uniref:hypothetical protein n=1 Tax=Streptomyces sp. NBC_01187 TaxID=2903766 RepID=UPI0038671418|nr:hypothetical protein OG220_25040 [Streptomyces sp. NBC_01187]
MSHSARAPGPPTGTVARADTRTDTPTGSQSGTRGTTTSGPRRVDFDAWALTDDQFDGLVRRLTGPLTRLVRFDAWALTDGQFDELVHRLIDPLTRLLRTEFRLDRERVGALRDPRR